MHMIQEMCQWKKWVNENDKNQNVATNGIINVTIYIFLRSLCTQIKSKSKSRLCIVGNCTMADNYITLTLAT